MRKITTWFFHTLIISCIFITTTSAQTVWTYDFGEVIGTFSSGDETNPVLLPSTQENGGNTKLRIGGGNNILLSDSDNNIGTFSRMVMESPPTGSLNIFGIGGFVSNELFYFRSTFKISVSEPGNENTFYIVLNGEGGFDVNTIDTGSLFGGLKFDVINDGNIDVNRRSGSGIGSWTNTFDFGVGLFDLDELVTVEIYANNSLSGIKYFRNGEEFSLESGFYAVYFNGNRIAGSSGDGDAAKTGDFTAEDDIHSVRFMSGATSGDEAQIEIDEIVYSNSLPDLRTISGDEGWRMLASPMDGVDVEQLARQNLVQGIAGSYPGDESNIYTSHSGQDDPGSAFWAEPAGLGESINKGQGFIWYLYNNAQIKESKPLPMDLLFAKNQSSGDVTIDLTTANDGWSLVGNPFSEDLLVDDIANWGKTGGSLASNTAQVWNPSLSSYEVLGGSSGDKVASFQGFYLQSDDASDITIPESQKSSNAIFYKESIERGVVEFEVISEQVDKNQPYRDKAFKLYLGEDAEHGWDLNDAHKLVPLATEHIGIGFVGQHINGDTTLKAQESRPYNFNESWSIPVTFFSSGVTGKAELSVVKTLNLPENMIIEIEDLSSGKRQRLDPQNPFQFDFTPTSSPGISDNNFKAASLTIPQNAVPNTTSRFIFHIHPDSKTYDFSQIPDEFSLGQNYPNPFNPTTTINYSLPEPSDVQITVFDMLGRQITELVNSRINAGNHTITFDASNLSSGVYLYRMKANQEVYIQKLTVMK